MTRAIGIDLGTAYSSAAFIDNGEPRLIISKGGTHAIPSVFAIDENGNPLTGEQAEEIMTQAPAQTVAGTKRLVGRTFGSSQLEQVQQHFLYDMVEGRSSEVLIQVNKQLFTLEQISAAILTHLRELAQEITSEEIVKAVIAVPAYYNDRQRQAVRAAGKLAGLKVLRVLNEPTAAALTYGLNKSLHERIAIYDLGAGTFDITVIELRGNVFDVLATGGDSFLGGMDFDDRIVRHILHHFLDETSVDLSFDRNALARIRQACEVAKIQLSTHERTRIEIPRICLDNDEKPLDLRYDLGRPELEELSSDLVEKTITTCRNIFRDAGDQNKPIDKLLVIGGQSQMPLVHRKLEAFFGKPPSTELGAETSVAIGATLMADALDNAGMDAEQELTLLDVLPIPIGLDRGDDTMHILFGKHEPLPCQRTRTITTSEDDQTSLLLRVYQGQSRFVNRNELLGTFIFTGIAMAPKGQKKLNVSFHVDSEGILSVQAKDDSTGELVDSRIKLSRNPRDLKRKAHPLPPSSLPQAPLEELPIEKPELPTFDVDKTQESMPRVTINEEPQLEKIAEGEKAGVVGRLFGGLFNTRPK